MVGTNYMETNSKFLNIHYLNIVLIQLYNFKSILVDDYTREFSCLLYDQPAGSEGLHETATKQLGKRVSECACELQDTALLAKLAAGDMIAIESKYVPQSMSLCIVQQSQTSPTNG